MFRAARAAARCVWPAVSQAVVRPGMMATQTLPAAITQMRVASMRQFHASTSTLSLSEVVKAELAHEEAEYEADATLATPPHGFTLTEVPGKTEMTLSKQHEGEEVSVLVNLLDQQQDEDADELDDEGDDEAVPKYPISFTVEAVKGGQTLQFSCMFMEDDVEVHIDHVAMLDKGADSKADVYEGPNFSELDEKLQEELYNCLKDRGVTAELGQWLCRLLYEKESKEYMSWLTKLSKFAA